MSLNTSILSPIRIISGCLESNISQRDKVKLWIYWIKRTTNLLTPNYSCESERPKVWL